MLTLCIVSTSFGAMPATALDGIAIDSNGAGLGEADAQHLASYRLAVPVVGVTKQRTTSDAEAARTKRWTFRLREAGRSSPPGTVA
jgi:hypothetical protein